MNVMRRNNAATKCESWIQKNMVSVVQKIGNIHKFGSYLLFPLHLQRKMNDGRERKSFPSLFIIWQQKQ